MDFPNRLERPCMKMHARAILQYGRARQKLQAHVHAPRRAQAALRRKHHAPLNRTVFHPGEIHRRPLSGLGALDAFSAGLQAAHSQKFSFGQQLHFVANAHLPGKKRAGDHRAEPFHCERPVDGQPEIARRVFGFDFVRGGTERGFQFRKPLLCFRADFNDRRLRQKGPFDKIFNLESGQLPRVVVRQIAFGQRNHAVLDPEQAANVEMLARLRLDRLIGRNRQQHQVDSRSAGQHVSDEALVPWHIHEAVAHAALFEKREAQVNRDPAPLFLLEPVGMRSGQCFDQGGFAVINMPGRADNHAFVCGGHSRGSGNSMLRDFRGGGQIGPGFGLWRAGDIWRHGVILFEARRRIFPGNLAAGGSSSPMPASTDFLEKLRIEHPIFQAPLAGGSDTPELVAAVGNAGALGFIGAAYLAPEQIVAAGRAVGSKTSRPFGINLFAPTPSRPDASIEAARKRLEPYFSELGLPAPSRPGPPTYGFAEQLAAALETGASVFSFTFGMIPPDAVKAIKTKGIYLLGTATTVEEALALEKSGVHGIVTQGSEAGGHRGTFQGDFAACMVGTISLVPQVVDAVRVPVVASGGIMDGRGIAAALALGAAAVQTGTAFLTCTESGAPEAYKEAILHAREDQTRLTRVFSGRPARGIVNRFMQEMESSEKADEIPAFPLQNGLTRPLRTAAGKQGRSEFLSLWAGQGVGMARRQSAAELTSRLVEETETVIRRFSRSSKVTSG